MTGTAAAVLEIHGLSKTYGRMRAVRDLALTVARGEVYGLLGPNGSGKTTTLGAALGAVRPDKGNIRWFGEAASARQRRRVGAILEQPSFYPWLSGAANLQIIAAIKGLSARSIDGPLATVGLSAAQHRLFAEYSLGMKQRLALAGALLGEPEVLVLDEPTNGVDAQGIYDIRGIISDFAARGGTVILASHILDEVEKVCSHVAILKDGAVLKAGAIAAVLATAGWIEVAAEDVTKLAAALHELEPAAAVVANGQRLEVHRGSLSPSALNSALAAKGIALSHLVACQPGLETQYLELVGRGANA